MKHCVSSTSYAYALNYKPTGFCCLVLQGARLVLLSSTILWVFVLTKQMTGSGWYPNRIIES